MHTVEIYENMQHYYRKYVRIKYNAQTEWLCDNDTETDTETRTHGGVMVIVTATTTTITTTNPPAKAPKRKINYKS